MENIELFDDLIVKYLAGEASDEEVVFLTQEISESEELAAHFMAMKNVWDTAVSPDCFDDEKVTRDYEKVLEVINQDARHQRMIDLSRLFQRVAAVLFLPLLALTVYLLVGGGHPEVNRFVELSQDLTTMPGTRMHTILPDSSEVWINGGSNIVYSQTSDGYRNINLNGEAFFKVAHDSEHPFIVKAGSVNVEATGTEFNVCSYPTDSLVTVTLTEGSVMVTEPYATTDMAPGQMIVYNKSTDQSRLYLGNTDKNIAWRHGRLVFKNETLGNVFKRLGQIYGLKFEVDPKLCDILFFATFEDVSLEQALMLIRKSTALEYDATQAAGSSAVIRVKSRR